MNLKTGGFGEVMHANVLTACDTPVSDLEMVALFLRRHSELTHRVWEEGWEKRVHTVKNHIQKDACC